MRECDFEFVNGDGEPRCILAREQKARRDLYARAMNICCWPGCSNQGAFEVHHITPIKRGGSDHFTNFICLCRHCHRHHRLHNLSEDHTLELLVYKFYQEKLILGYSSDELTDMAFIRALKGQRVHFSVVTKTEYEQPCSG